MASPKSPWKLDPLPGAASAWKLDPTPEEQRSAETFRRGLGLPEPAPARPAREETVERLGFNRPAPAPSEIARRERMAQELTDQLRKGLPKYQGFGAALWSGLNDLGALTSSAFEAVGEASGWEGLEQAGEFGREKFTGNNARNEALEGDRGRFADIRSVGDALGWARQTAGNMIPVMVPGMMGGAGGAALGGRVLATVGGVKMTVGGVVGAFIPSATLGVGEVQMGMKEKDPDSEADGWVFLGGTAIGALDAALPGMVGSKLIKVFGRESAEEIAMRALLRPASQTTLARVTREAGKDAMIEGITESVQEAIGEVTASLAAEQKIDWSALPANMLESAAAGALMGGGTGAVTGYAAARSERAARAPGEAAERSAISREAMLRTLPPLTDEDRASPFPDAIIQEGKARIAEILGEGTFAEKPSPLAPLEPAEPRWYLDEPDAKPARFDPEAPAVKPAPVANGRAVAEELFPQASITSGYRGPDHPLSRANPSSWHTKGHAAVDMKPIPGMTFEQAKQRFEQAGYTLIEALNETGKGKTKHATGDHWHFVLGQGGEPGITPDSPVAEAPEETSGLTDAEIDAVGRDTETPEDMIQRVLGDDILNPQAGERVEVTRNGKTVPGVIESVWDDDGQQGVRIRQDDGKIFDEALDDMREIGARITSPVTQIESESAPTPADFAGVQDVQGGNQVDSTADLAGEKIDDDWTAFNSAAGNIRVPRADMPQIKAEHRGAMVNYLKGRGITSEEVEIRPGTLRPSQAEFSPAKVQKAREFEGGNRAILISSDGYVVDGHHQWLAARDQAIAEPGKTIRAIRLNAPIREALDAAATFPSAGVSDEGPAGTSEAPQGGAQLEDTPSGKGVAVIGGSAEQMAAITRAIPNAKGMPRRDGALVYSKKYEAQIREALGASAPAAQPTQSEDEVMGFMARGPGYEAEIPAAMSAQDAKRIAAEDSGLSPWQIKVERMKVGDTLAGGVPVAEAAAAAQARDTSNTVDDVSKDSGETVETNPLPDFAGAINRDLSREQVDAVAAIFDRAEARARGEPQPEPVEAEEFKRVWNSKEFKAVRKARGEPHRESPVGADMVRGWRDGQAGNIEALRANVRIAERQAKGIKGDGQNAFNPIQPYIEAYYAAATGKTAEVRTKGGFRDVLSPAQALAEIEAGPSEPTPAAPKKPRAKKEPPRRVARAFRMGDFYEFFGEDAKAVAGVLDIAITSRTLSAETAKKLGLPEGFTAMAGIPAWSVEQNRADLAAAGIDVEIAGEQAAPAAEPSPNRLVTEERAEELRARLREKLNPNRLNAGIDPELLAIGAELMVYHVEKGARRFAAAAKAIASDLDLPLEALRKYLRGWYNGARDFMEDSGEFVAGMDTADEVGRAMRTFADWADEGGGVQNPPQKPESPPFGNDPAGALRERLLNGPGFASITEARKFIAEQTGKPIKAGTAQAKRADEMIEAAVVQVAREIVAQGNTPVATYRALVGLYDRQPNLAVRSSTSVEQQAYSTPMPLAYLASQRAGITAETTVYEPTAGNGALLIAASPENITANELNPDRAETLRAMLPEAGITAVDAMQLANPPEWDAVIANPPFGPLRDASGENIVFDLGGGYETREIDHAIAMKALEAMKDGGRATLLVGGINKQITDPKKRRDAYNGKAKREFYYRLYSEYNVTDHFTVAGELYAKQGAGWPVDVIVIEGRGKSQLPLPAVQAPRVLDSWNALEGELDGRGNVQGPAGEQAGSADLESVEPASGDARDRGGSGSGRVDRQQQRPEPGEPGAVRERPAAGEPGSEGLAERPARRDAEPAQSDRDRAGRGASDVAVAGENARQVAYRPASSATSLDTLVPVNMQTAISLALDRLQDRVGNVDYFVADRLGYDPDDISDYFSAEQVDALALAIDNMERGAGFIIGDQTGIGKGRVVAGVIRYAMKSGRMPIFVTEKPTLYADMYRDMADIGIPEMLGRPVDIVMTNAAEKVPLNEEGTEVLKTPAASQHNARLAAIAGGDRDNVDVVFTTYSQMQALKGELTVRQQVLDQLAPGSILILDESHNAGGQGKAAAKKGAAPNRAEFVRKIAAAAHGVFFSSATYAKRPEVMDLYASTDMHKAVADISNLADAIIKGGIPMQQVVASMLAEAGQYVRRERSFDGIEYRTPPIEVDRAAYSQFTSVLRGIQQFQEKHIADIKESISEEIRAEAKSVSSDGSVGGAGAISTNFTSVMHNVVEQMLLSLKAIPAADMAIEALKADQKPVITLANTMGSFLEEYATENDIGNGQPMPLDFRQLLIRYLDRTRRITLKKPFSSEKAEVHIISDRELGDDGVAAYDAVRRQIEAMDLSALPVSPVDAIRNRIREAGYTIGEITGRSATLDYSGGVPTYRIRPGKESSIQGKRDAITRFNDGRLDVMILNQSGSTGLSLHASEKFKDQRPRRMILAQAERNIDTHMQMLGRVHRTGQVVLPSYDQLVAAVPAEMRPAAVLAKKMASLNANTTGARDSAMTGEDVPDFMNEYGDEIAARMMEEDTALHRLLGDPLPDSDGEEEGLSRDNAARRVTGRLMLLPLEEQEAFYERFLADYGDYLAQKEAAGEATLEAKTLDLDAQTLGSAQVIAPTDSASPFGEGVYLEALDVKRQARPMKPEAILAEIAAGADATQPDEPNGRALELLQGAGKLWVNGFRDEQLANFDAYRREVLDGIDPKKYQANADRLDANRKLFDNLMRMVYPGAAITITGDGGTLPGIVLSVEKKGERKNPLALGAYRAHVALLEGRMTIPFSQLRDTYAEESFGTYQVASISQIEGEPPLRAFEGEITARESRTMLTGNILAAYEHTLGKGQIVNFTRDDGSLSAGIMMAKGYDYKKDMAKRPVAFRTAAQVADWLARGEKAFADAVSLERLGSQLVATAAASKGLGGKYYLNSGVRAVTGDFFKKSTGMVATTSPSNALDLADALMKAGAVFTAKTNLEEARTIIAGTRAELPPRGSRRALAPIQPSQDDTRLRGELRAQLERFGIADRIALDVGRNLRLANPGAKGEAGSGLISIALDKADNPSATLSHETVHAMRDLGLFTPAEWRSLTNEAWENPGIRRRIERTYGGRGMSLDDLKEEAAAEHFADYWRDVTLPRSLWARAYRRILGFMAAVARVMGGGTALEARLIQQKIISGEIGARATGSGDAARFEGVGARTFGRKGGNRAQLDEQEEEVVYLAGSEPTWQGKMAEGFDRFRTAMQDRYLPLLKVQREIERQTGRTLPNRLNPYLGEELMTGRIGARLEELNDKHIGPLFDAMHAEKVSLDELETYLYARHAPERNARIAEINPDFEGPGSGMSDIQAAAVMSRVEKAGQTAAMERLAARVDAIRDNALDFRVETGLMSQEQADAWREGYENYVPLRGFAETGEGDAAVAERINRSGGGITVRGRESKRAFGRRSKADSILAYLILQSEEAIVRGETNRVAQRFVKLAEENPDKEFWQVNKVTYKRRLNMVTGLVQEYVTTQPTAADADWTVTAKFEGREHRVTMNNRDPGARRLADAMRNLTQHQLDWVTLHLGKLNRFLSAVNTSWNPEFVITNAFRDVQTAGINLMGIGVEKLTRRTAGYYPAALKASMQGEFGKDDGGEWAQWRDEFVKEGGRVYFNRVEDVGLIKKRIESAFALSAARAGQGTPLLQIKRGLVAVKDLVENLNGGVENAVRLAAYRAGREGGMTRTQAASMAKNLTVNFSRRGTFSPAMNALYLFYNASVQGSVRMLMAMRSPRVQKVLVGVVAAGFGVEMMNAMVSATDDDDELFYDKIPDYEKSRNLIIMLPGGSDYVKLPLPWGYNAVWEAGRSIGEIARRGGDRWQGSVGNWMTTVADAFNPVGGTESLLNLIAPTVVDPIVDINLNRDFTGRPIMPEENQYGPEEPDSQRYWNSVGTHWKSVTDFLASASGGSDVEPGSIDVSPETLEHLAGVVVGAAGATLDRIISIPGKAATGDLSTNDIPLARKVTGSTPPWHDKAQFYDRLGEVEQQVHYAKGYIEAGRIDEARALAEDRRAVLTMEPAAKAARKDMRQIRKERRANDAALELGQINAATHKANAQKLDDAEDAVILNFNRTWNATLYPE